MKKRKKRMNKKKVALIVFILALIGSIGFYVYVSFFKSEEKIESKSKVVDSIDKYGYTISDTDTKLFKTKFKELKRLLSSENVDEKKYSELVAELFVIDFFSLDNKVTKNDIGGVEYVYSNYKSTFVDKARDEFYRFVNNNLNDDRNQELPVVSSIKVKSSEETSASEIFNKEELENIEKAYKINLSWTYEKDLGYQNEATLIVVKDGEFKFSVAKIYSEEDEEDSTNDDEEID